MMYEIMKERVERALEKGGVGAELASSEEDQHMFQKWKQFSRNKHPSVVKVSIQIYKIVLPVIRITCYNKRNWSSVRTYMV
jgi:hypothetical protein